MTGFTVTIVPEQWQFQAAPDETLFMAARRAGIRIPTLCRNGTCRTCFSTLLSGQVRYLVEWPGLSREEKAEGHVLPCVAVPLSDIVLTSEYLERDESRA